MGMRPRAIEVRIEELVLEGFSSADGPRIGAAVERELGRLFAEHGVPPAVAAGLERAAVDGGSFAHAPQATPSATGTRVARAAYGGLKK
jgi:hypothetical protein